MSEALLLVNCSAEMHLWIQKELELCSQSVAGGFIAPALCLTIICVDVDSFSLDLRYGGN